MRKIGKVIVFIGLAAAFTACSSNADSDFVPVNISIPPVDEACCPPEEEVATANFLATLKEVKSLEGLTAGKYTVKVYSRDSFHVGYNDLYFSVVETETQRHVRLVEFFNLTSLMTMGAMGGMQHSTPQSVAFEQVESHPVFHAWLSFLMPSDNDKGNIWHLSFSARIKGTQTDFNTRQINVSSAPEGTAWLKSFKYKDHTYYLSLVNPTSLKTGINTLQAYVSLQGDDRTLPYLPAEERFTIEITPTMPEMGNHSSPNNEALQRQENGIYEGKLNLTMTGVWDIHLVVKDADGNTVAGADNNESGYSSLYWTVNI